jgi:hypothetical protein
MKMNKIIYLLKSITLWTILGSIATILGLFLSIYTLFSSPENIEKTQENKPITKDNQVSPKVNKEIFRLRDTINFSEATSLYQGNVFFTSKKTSNNNVMLTFRGGQVVKDPHLAEMIKYQGQREQPGSQGLDLQPGSDEVIKASGVTNIITAGIGDRFYFYEKDYSSGKGKLYTMDILLIKGNEMIFEIINDFATRGK